MSYQEEEYFTNHEEELIQDILSLCENSIRDLRAVWRRTFDQKTCENNFCRLKSHTQAFFDDLVKESLTKETFIKTEINELRNEADNLRRLLKTEVELPVHDADDDIPLLVIQLEMDKSLSDLREQLRQRKEQICELLLEQESLCEELGEPPRELLADPLPTALEIENFREYLDALKCEREDRSQRLHAMRREIKGYLQILDLKVNTDYDDRLLNQRQIQLSKQTFNDLERLQQRFATQVDELKCRIIDMRTKLNSLWDRLNTPLEERQKVERFTKLEQVTADVLMQELNRCEELKRQNIKHYIQKIRIEIEQWWDLTLKSEKERRRFTHFSSNNYCDELLTLHEMELDDLKQYYEANQQIFVLYADRSVLWERMTALEEKANDPARYNNRGGQLLREEKERKTIASKLPKIEQQIRELVQTYQEREHQAFLVNGENILQLIESDWEKKRQEKEAHTKARKNAVSPQAGINRSHVSSATRTPLMQRNASVSSLRKTPSHTNPSNTKRNNLAATGSGVKRKLPESDRTTPNAKRSLCYSFKKPSASSAKKSTGQALMSTKPAQKKPPRVLATLIRPPSTRRSSLKRRSSGRIEKPKIVVTNATIVSEIETDDDNYDSFKKCISLDARSSIKHESTAQVQGVDGRSTKRLAEAKKRRQLQKLAALQENQREENRFRGLPKPSISRTPSKQNIRGEYPISPGTSASKKLTTKNLPILI